MGKFARISRIISGLLMIILGIVMAVIPEDGYVYVIIILSVSVVALGIKQLVYYFTMARFMVGGKEMLFIGIIALDFGMLTLSFSTVPKIFLVMYLIVVRAFSGVIDIMRGTEERSFDSPHWKITVSYGVVNLAVALLALISGLFIRSTRFLVYIYSVGLIYSGISRVVSAFRKTAVIYIQ